MWNIPPWWPDILGNPRPMWEVQPGLSHEELTELRELLAKERAKGIQQDDIQVKQKVLKKLAAELGVEIQFVERNQE